MNDIDDSAECVCYTRYLNRVTVYKTCYTIFRFCDTQSQQTVLVLFLIYKSFILNSFRYQIAWNNEKGRYKISEILHVFKRLADLDPTHRFVLTYIVFLWTTEESG